VFHHQTGLLVTLRAPECMAASFRWQVLDAELRRRLGEQGQRCCEEMFNLEAHTQAALEQYALVLAQCRNRNAS